jgi:hypothetical protein
VRLDKLYDEEVLYTDPEIGHLTWTEFWSIPRNRLRRHRAALERLEKKRAKKNG